MDSKLGGKILAREQFCKPRYSLYLSQQRQLQSLFYPIGRGDNILPTKKREDDIFGHPIINGILRNPDRTRTQTRTRTKPELEKNPDSTLGLTEKTRTRLIKKTEFKTDSLKNLVLPPFSKLRNRKKLSCKSQFYETNCYKKQRRT